MTLFGRVATGLLVTGLLLLGGCTATSLTPEKQAGIRRIAVVSALGDKMKMKNVPLFRWDQDEFSHPIKDWALDEFAVRRMSDLLRDQYEVVPLEVPSSALQRRIVLPDRDGVLAEGAKPADVLGPYQPSPPPDAYVMLLERRTLAGSTGTVAEGIGVLRWPSIIGNLHLAHTIYVVAVVDGKTLEPLASVEGEDAHRSPFAGNLHANPYADVDESYWLEGEGELPADMQGRLKAQFETLLTESLPGALQRLKLLPKPAPKTAP